MKKKMKKILSIIIFLFLTTACATTRTISQPIMADMKLLDQEKEVSHVTAVNALHLRDFPEEYGGDVIATMPNGAEFVVRSCLTTTSGTVWAYGEYVMPEGSMYGWAAARYISGGCDG